MTLFSQTKTNSTAISPQANYTDHGPPRSRLLPVEVFHGQHNGNYGRYLRYLDRNRYYSFRVAP
jgi:hypothetical protein